jgi:hypothetical protein
MWLCLLCHPDLTKGGKQQWLLMTRLWLCVLVLIYHNVGTWRQFVQQPVQLPAARRVQNLGSGNLFSAFYAVVGARGTELFISSLLHHEHC